MQNTRSPYGTLRRPTERNTVRMSDFGDAVENLCIIRVKDSNRTRLDRVFSLACFSIEKIDEAIEFDDQTAIGKIRPQVPQLTYGVVDNEQSGIGSLEPTKAEIA